MFLFLGAVAVRGPRNITTQVGADIFMECTVTGVEPKPLLQWRLSGKEYTPSSLPKRFFSNSTGLNIYSISPGDNGLAVQCFVVVFDPSIARFVSVSSPVGVIHVTISGDELEETGRAVNRGEQNSSIYNNHPLHPIQHTQLFKQFLHHHHHHHHYQLISLHPPV